MSLSKYLMAGAISLSAAGCDLFEEEKPLPPNYIRGIIINEVQTNNAGSYYPYAFTVKTDTSEFTYSVHHEYAAAVDSKINKGDRVRLNLNILQNFNNDPSSNLISNPDAVEVIKRAEP